MGTFCCSDTNKETSTNFVIIKPEIDMSAMTKKALNVNFPNAMKGTMAELIIYEKLKCEGFNAENTLYADCSCPDEINHDDPDEDISSLFQRRWGEIFPLAGLAGFPFTGKTGWAAFSHHVPADGNIVVLFAPHVGICTNGTVGQILREGQTTGSAACGAAIGAY
jgi:hypothetical protein